MPRSPHLQALILRILHGQEPGYTPPATLDVGLSTTDPGADGTGKTEPVGNNYGRVSVANTAAFWGISGVRAGSLAIVTFPTPTPSGWGTIGWVLLFEGGTNTLWGWAAIPSTVVAANTPPKFPIGQLGHTEVTVA